jgi:glycosyltransferase involved in cell wall biosynthesis
MSGTKQVLVVSPDMLPLPGLPTTGSGLRAWAIAKGLESRGHDVLLSLPFAALVGREQRVPADILDLAWREGALKETIDNAGPDILVVCGWPLLSNIARHLDIPIAVDQHGPHLIERLFQRHRTLQENIAEKIGNLRKADFFTCAGEKQEVYFLPWLMQAGFDITGDVIGTIPVSLSPQLPEHRYSEELTFVYGGVFLPWQDPSLSLLTLVENLEARQRGLLKFFGGKHPFIPVDTGVFELLRARLSASERVVISEMIPHDQLLGQYVKSHVAIDVMARNVERELAFTTRTVEYLWCGLPVIHNDYSELSKYIEEYQAGWVVDPADKEVVSRVINAILDSPDMVSEYGANAQRLVKDRFTWDRTIEPLDRFCKNPQIRREPARDAGLTGGRRDLVGTTDEKQDKIVGPGATLGRFGCVLHQEVWPKLRRTVEQIVRRNRG